MWNACRKAFAAIVGLLLFTSVFAQEYPNSLSVDSVTPYADSLMIKAMRAKMDSVHRVAQRPTVALVFSGGGAKGAAEVGVLRYIEEQGIPIDMVIGTSIGGLVGALYSLGYSVDEVQYQFQNQDWSTMLSDAIDQKYYSYQYKMYRDKYLISFPFHYDSANVAKTMDRTSYTSNDGRLKIGAVETQGEQVTPNKFTNSLPAGYAYGFNVNNLISSLTVGYQDSISFINMPVPFFCVATDVVSCKAKNWGSGSLKNAMRSTMSIPGLFNPVRTDGMILVDGGTRNNFPTDLAKAMGADYIIGIDLSDIDLKYSQVNNLGDVLSQFITMLGKDAFEKNVVTPDVFVKPRISEYNMLSFSREAIDTMLVRGYEAAEAESHAFEALSSLVGSKGTQYNGPKAINIAQTPVRLEAIIFDGLDDDASSILMDLVDIDIRQMVDKAAIDKAMTKLQATKLFDAVTYSLYGSAEPYRLVFHCSAAPVHHMGMGVRVDTEDWASLLLNVGINVHKLMGSTLNIEARVGRSQTFKARYSLVSLALPVLNAEFSAGHVRGRISGVGDRNNEMLSYLYHNESVYLSSRNWSSADMRIGMRARYFSLPQGSHFGNHLDGLSSSMLSGYYVGPFAQANIYTMDDLYYPSRGMDFKVEAGYDMWKLNSTGYSPIFSGSASLRFVVPFGKGFAIIPDIRFRSVLDANDADNYSLSHRNMLGGRMSSRYLDHHMPFLPVNDLHLIEQDHMITASVDLRSRLAKNLYLSVIASAVRASDNYVGLIKFDEGLFNYGAGLELGYNTILGPVRANVHWSNLTNAVGAYLSIGYDF